MITPMKQLDLLLFHEEKEDFLEALREAGVIHITEDVDALSEKGVALQSEIVQVDKVLSALYNPKEVKEVAHGSGKELIEQFHVLTSQMDDLNTEKEILKKEFTQVEPWGDIDAAKLTELSEANVYITLFEVPKKQKSLLKPFTYELINEAKGKLLVAIVTEEEPAKIEGLEKVTLPSRSLAQIQELSADNSESRAAIAVQIDAIAGRKAAIVQYRQELLEQLLMEKARTSMADMAEGHVLHMHGWFPKVSEVAVIEVCEDFSCWFETAEPQEEDIIPVEIQNKGMFKLFEPLTKMFSLPDYYEIDPTSFIAPFFALFFGLCLGDLGYGSLVVIGAIIALFKLSEEKKPMILMVMILGIMTMISGFMLNTFFGMPIFSGSNQTLLSQMAFLKTTDGSTIYPAMAFAVYLGFTQIILANILRLKNAVSMESLKSSLQPLATLLLIIAAFLALVKSDFLDMRVFSIGSFQLGEIVGTVPDVIFQVSGIAGLALLFISNFTRNPKRNPIGNGLMFIISIYNFATGLMGDSLSYIRLFALGLAGGLLGLAFNQLALSFITIDGQIVWLHPMALLTVGILVMGHSLNFFLALIGSFVHPLRLTFVEFYGNLGFKGGAIPYTPLKSKKQQ